MSTTKQPSNLQTAGFRYVERKGVFNWMDPVFMQPGDVDCTDMDDDTFANFVRHVLSFPVGHDRTAPVVDHLYDDALLEDDLGLN